MENENLTIGELLELYPGGFSVGPGGDICKTICASSHFAKIAQAYPVVPYNGGYLVVEMVEQSQLITQLNHQKSPMAELKR